MISATRTDSGGINLVGTNDEGFCLQGHVNDEEAITLIRELAAVLVDEDFGLLFETPSGGCVACGRDRWPDG